MQWGQKSWQFFVRTLGETMTSQIHSETNWPLGADNIAACFFGWIQHAVFDAMDINSLTESYHSIKDELRTAECFAGCASLGFTTKPRDAKLHVTKQQCTVRFTDFFEQKPFQPFLLQRLFVHEKWGTRKMIFSDRLCQPRFCNFKATPSGLRYSSN